MQAQLKQLLPFLHDRNPQVRQVALDNLVGYTPKGSPYRDLFLEDVNTGGLQPKDSSVVRDLKLLCRDQMAIAHDAFKALINLSDSSLLASSLADPLFLGFLVSYIANPPSVLADLASMLLSNVTAFPLPANNLLSLEIPLFLLASSSIPYYPPSSRCTTSPYPEPYPEGAPTRVRALRVLVDAFVSAPEFPPLTVVEGRPPKPDAGRHRKGELHFLANVFANMSVISAGRSFFFTPTFPTPLPSPQTVTGDSTCVLEYPLSKLVPFIEHSDTMRRGGVISTIKNCAFYTAGHKVMLASDSELVSMPPDGLAAPGLGILPSLLLPLAGSEEFDLDETDMLPPALQFLPSTKVRDPDPIIRLALLETLLLLCTTRHGRACLRENGVYLIVRALHLVEQDERVSEHIVRLVNLLQREEETETEVDWEDVEGNASGPTKKSATVPQIDEDDGIIKI
ncbi:hypothetical protein BS47DRAFT_1325043 [Hydnum rufescens UP504]|uniref:Protein HGH1 homolog n=1 Tax=Hydnum rufescens UP504 TaxID=1448309 RepID=A0A9P6B7I8_9AGAM|nr:hypothetical protein BS47DRAFT_1325043 [Hydnum rufescens UP504]